MKIRQIRFRNINSFYGEHPPIQFNEGLLSTTGLFVISGPTGAGKSTLLDVITLALFNRVPRISGAISNSSIIEEGILVNQQAALEPGTAAYAEIEYEVGGKAYRSRWSIKKNRNGNWNNYEMEIAFLPEGQTEGQLLPIKGLSEFPKKNEELIGLTYDQFIRSIVLAQGAFDQFLKARAAERSKMLERITGTEIYRQLSQRAHQVNREYELQIREKRQEAGLISVLTDEQVEELKNRRKAIETRLDELAGAVVFYTNEEKYRQQIADADQQLAVLTKRQQGLEEKQRAFVPEALRLQRHERVADLAAEFADIANAERNRQIAEQDQQAARNQLGQLVSQQTVLIEKARTLTRKANLTEQTFEKNLNDFRETVLDLVHRYQTERDKAKPAFSAIKKELENTKLDWFRVLDVRDVDGMAERVNGRLTELNLQLVQIEQEYPSLTPASIQTELNRLLEQDSNLAELRTLLVQQQERLLDGTALNGKINDHTAFLNQQQTPLNELAAEVSELQQKIDQLQHKKRRLTEEADLDELRKALQDGEPCPLCGSPDHPYARHYINQVGTLDVELQVATADWENKKKEYETLQGRLLKIQLELDTYSEQRNQLRRAYSEKKTMISNRLSTLALDPELSPEEITDAQQFIQKQRDELNEIRMLWEHETVLRRLSDDLKTVQESKVQAEILKAQKEQLFAGEDVRTVCEQLAGQFNTVWSRINAQQSLLDKAVSSHTEADHAYQRLTKTVLPVLQERGFDGLADARACLLETAEVRRLQELKTVLHKEAEELTRRQAEETGKRREALDACQTALSLEEVTAKLREIKQEETRERESIGYYKRQLEEDKEKRRNHKKLLNVLEKLEADARPWRELDRLIGSAKGDDYSKFAQGLTLAQLIGLANRRLKDLSDRYLLLKPRDGQDELYVVDLYQGSTERTVSSLSGGETFTLSLALALGLSDLASQNVQIESLFIDEGFGTLDPDALDTAIAMLEKLQHDSKKTIGIISHRHEIKERISVQIQVEKGMEGNSKIKVLEL
ncbi:AAA family ATPase [Larkinella arboricola]